MENKLKFENGKLIAPLSYGLDSDKDGVKSVLLEASLTIDAVEAVTEIWKNAPEFLLQIVANLQVK